MRPIAGLTASLTSLALTLATALPAVASDVEIRLTSGERVYGELISDNADAVDINRKVWTKSGLIAGKAEYPRKRIAEMQAVDSLDELYKKRAAETPDTFDGQFTLAKWCFDRGLQDQAFTHAKKLYDRDPSDQVSQDLMQELGYVRDGDQWLKESDYAAKHGLVVYDGKLMTPAQVDLRKASLKADVERDNTIARQRSLDGNETAAERRVADAKARVDKIKQAQADLKQQEAQAKQAAGRQQRAAGGGRNQQGGNQPGGNQQQAQAGGVGITQDFTDQQKQLDKSAADAQKSVDSATKDLQTAKDAQAKGKEAIDQAQKASDAAHQAYLDSMPKDDKAAAAPGAKPAADAAKPAADTTKPAK